MKTAGSIHFHWSVSLAETAAAEEHHSEEADDPEGEGHIEIIGHSPDHIVAIRLHHRAGADRVVFCEEQGTNNDRKDKLDETGSGSANDRAESPSVSPDTNEHENCVQGNNAVGGSHQTGDKSELRARLLAVNVTVLNQINPVFQKVTVEVLITPVHFTSDRDIGAIHVGFVVLIS